MTVKVPGQAGQDEGQLSRQRAGAAEAEGWAAGSSGWRGAARRFVFAVKQTSKCCPYCCCCRSARPAPSPPSPSPSPAAAAAPDEAAILCQRRQQKLCKWAVGAVGRSSASETGEGGGNKPKRKSDKKWKVLWATTAEIAIYRGEQQQGASSSRGRG